MRKENCIRLLLAGIAALFFTGHSAVAADEVVVIPLFTTETCTEPDEVKSAGYCWKDRNLGASRVATSSGDNAAFGGHYQWGRPRDGHQNLYSATIPVLSLNDVPGHGGFITNNSLSLHDWRNPQNNNLWQGLGGVNNPCAQGFRVPTKTEFEAEIAFWGVNGRASDAFESPLRLVVAGSRLYYNGDYSNVNVKGGYWSSTVDGSGESYYLLFGPVNAAIGSSFRADGKSVRCIKD